MSNWADFAISAVKRGPELGQISQVQVHEDRGKEFGPAVIVDKHAIASDINNGRFNLLKWDRQEKVYYPLEINLYEKGKIDE